MGLEHSFKFVGQKRNQVMLFVPHASSEPTRIERFQHTDSDNARNWSALAEKVTSWLNTNVAPHQLVSLSIYEESHRNTSHTVHATVTHTVPIEQQSLPEDAGANIYSFKVHRGAYQTPQMKFYMDLVETVNKTGVDQGHVVAVANDSGSSNFTSISLSYDPMISSKLKE